MSITNYYADIIPDIAKFKAIINTPLPVCIWTNTLKITPQKLAESLRADGIKVEPLPWYASAFRVISGSERLGKSWQYCAGLLQIQEEVSMLPGVLLQAVGGDKVLDLCAAPGNKTAQLALAMQQCGTLVANDRSYQRLRALGQTIKRLGLVNISTCVYDGVQFPNCGEVFDKVLVDVPCSCEGVLRKSQDKIILPDRARSLKRAVTQQQLLEKALTLCQPGGKILYSTCTFAPEENERVISQVLKKYPDKLQVIKMPIAHFKTNPGIMAWQGETYHAAVQDCLRIWPYDNNTGGFFIALLQKAGPVLEPRSHRGKAKITNDQPYLLPIADRFAIDLSVFTQYKYTNSSQRGIYLTNMDNELPLSITADATGLFFLKTKMRHPKMSTEAAMCLAAYAKQNKIALNAQQKRNYLTRQDFTITSAQEAQCTSTGYILIEYQGQGLGLALYFAAQDDKPALVRSLFPKSLSHHYQSINFLISAVDSPGIKPVTDTPND